MGNYNTWAVKKERGAIFCQSLNDFPCPVTLGKNTPSFGLHRYKQGLRFVPPDDEGFSLRGDKRRLLYKGRRRSHRFTILNDTAFEYDCILEKEPENNVITLILEGAENYDFFRQPDFVPDDFLKGSYAVYKKETLIGEGTGKLCHIHRPQIIDARGRRCWGDLSVDGDMLHITVPEWFLSEAKYPVVVDPTVGTTTVGSQTDYDLENDGYLSIVYIELGFGVNRFLIPETFNGNATGYLYCYNNGSDGTCKPVLYSDNGNCPLTRRSANEGLIDIDVTKSKPAGWRTANFSSNTSISSGTYIWYGIAVDIFYPRFDYGAKFYRCGIDELIDEIPNTFPLWDVNDYYNMKLSMYFTYSSAQNYVRKLTQGVNLTDTKRMTGNYKRSMTQTASVNSSLGSFENIYRQCVMTAHNTMDIKRFPAFFRNIAEQINVSLVFNHLRSISRKCVDFINIGLQTDRRFDAMRNVNDFLGLEDSQYFSVLFIRSVNDNIQITDIFHHLGEFIRGLRFNADSIAETNRKAEYKRFSTETVQAVGAVFRGLLLFVKIVSKVFIRDYLLRRFLIAKENLIIKSPVSREILLNSKIN